MPDYTPYIDEIYRYVFFAVGQHRETAEDLTSVILLKALEAQGKFDGTKSLARTYLYRIARNTLIDHYRHQPFAVQTEIPEEHPATQISADVQADIELVWRSAHNILEVDALQMMILKYRNDLPLSEIADVMHKSLDAVKSSLKRSRDQLQTALHL